MLQEAVTAIDAAKMSVVLVADHDEVAGKHPCLCLPCMHQQAASL